MRAARFEGDGVVVIDERPDPVAGPGEVVVEVWHCAYCGSDKRQLRHGASHVPGHEIVGRVVAVGDGPAAVSPGEAVAVYAPLFCGSCRWCRAGSTNRCDALAGVIGWQADGGFAELVRVPARNLLPVPPDIPLQRAVLSLDTIGTAANGLERATAAVDGGDGTVLVLGCGPLGLGAIAVARSEGRTVLAHDVSPVRLATAVSLGASRWDASAVGVEGAGPADSVSLVVEASGAPDAKALASNVVGQGGAVLMLSEGEYPWVLPASIRWRRTEATWVRSFYFPMSAVSRNWQLVRRVGEALEHAVVSHERFSELPRVSADFLAGVSIKPVVEIAGF